MVLAMVILLIVGILLFIGMLQTYNSIFYYSLFILVTIVFLLSILIGMPRIVIYSHINYNSNFVTYIKYFFIVTTVINLLLLCVLAFSDKTKKSGFMYVYIISTIVNIIVSIMCTPDIFLEEDIKSLIVDVYGSTGSFITFYLKENWYFLVIALIYSILFSIYIKKKNKYFFKFKKED